jgi:hypothetical protein
MRGKTMAADLEECNLGARILLTLLQKGEMQKPYALFGDRV